MGFPIRPVVAFYNDTSYKLARFLTQWFRLHSSFAPQHTITNFSHLASQFTDSFPPTSTLFSLDVSSMYTNIPVSQSVGYMLDHLRANNIHSDIISEFHTLINWCLKNICFYNGTLYEFPDGLPMGAPLSSLVADVFMDTFETEFLHSTLTPQPHILSWHRYVDDILGVWDGPPSALTNLLNYLNSLHPSINFTLEVGGSSINYLDLTISLTPHSHSHQLHPQFAIYRKPSNTGIFINGLSFHHISHKLSAFLFLINRLLSIPLSKLDFEKEKQCISDLARKNNIPIDVNKTINRKSLQRAFHSISTLRTPHLPSPLERVRWVRLPFLGNSSNHLSRFLRNYDYQPAFYSLLTEGHLSSLKDKLPLP